MLEQKSMKTKNRIMMALGFLLAVMASVAYAQSLADVARAERAKQSSQTQAVKVYTNDNFPRAAAMQQTTQLSPEGASAETPAKTSEAKPSQGESTAPSETSKATEPETKTDDKIKTKEYWQSKFAEAKAKLDKAEEELRLSEDELNLAQMNEARELDPQKQTELSQDVSAKRAAADTKRDEAEKVKQSLNDLNKEFEQSGAPKEWLQAEVKQ
jgi:hypothetical protein